MILSAASVRKRIPPGELGAESRALPEAAWPYGRAVFIEEPGVLTGDGKEANGARAKVGEVLASRAADTSSEKEGSTA